MSKCIAILGANGVGKSTLADRLCGLEGGKAPAEAIAPYTSQTVNSDGSYDIGYLPAGAYTLAFSCEAENDDPEIYDGIVIPSPSTERIEITLSEGESKSCNLPIVNGGC